VRGDMERFGLSLEETGDAVVVVVVIAQQLFS